MERYYQNDDDDQESFFDSGDDHDVENFVGQDGIIDVMHVELAQTELNHQLLDRAMALAKQSWLWYFRSAESRLKEVERIYVRLSGLTGGEREDNA